MSPRGMLSRSSLALLAALTGAACTEPDARPLVEPDDPDVQAPACASPPVAAWTGTATRVQADYPDDLAVSARWRLVETIGCRDRYVPEGTAQYHYAIPGAQCDQSIAPGDHAVAGGDGELIVDRSTSPATYQARAATTWQVTFTCRLDDGTEESQTFDGGGQWLEVATAVAGGRLEGERVLDDGSACGRGHAATPCTYAWRFDAAP